MTRFSKNLTQFYWFRLCSGQVSFTTVLGRYQSCSSIPNDEVIVDVHPLLIEIANEICTNILAALLKDLIPLKGLEAPEQPCSRVSVPTIDFPAHALINFPSRQMVSIGPTSGLHPMFRFEA